METLFSTREEWLTMAIDEWNNRLFKQAGFDLGIRKLKISCGFPPGQRGTKKDYAVVPSQYSRDGNTELFVSPAIAEPDKAALAVAACAAASCNFGGKIFTTLGVDENNLRGVAAEIAAELGGYPHASVDLSKLPKQSTRMHKCVCPECGYTVRISNKWLKVAIPDCPVHNVTMKTED